DPPEAAGDDGRTAMPLAVQAGHARAARDEGERGDAIADPESPGDGRAHRHYLAGKLVAHDRPRPKGAHATGIVGDLARMQVGAANAAVADGQHQLRRPGVRIGNRLDAERLADTVKDERAHEWPPISPLGARSRLAGEDRADRAAHRRTC